MRYVFALALVACSHSTEMRGDWCGTDRAEIRWAGELAEKCGAGDFLACERAEAECKRSAFFCLQNAPATKSTPEELRARLASSCAAGASDDCVELGDLLERIGEDPESTYEHACERGVTTACSRTGYLVSAHAAEAEKAANWDEAAQLHRLGCFKYNVPDECDALELLRARAKREATECEAGQHEICELAAAMLHATSQSPADEARADALKRRISR